MRSARHKHGLSSGCHVPRPPFLPEGEIHQRASAELCTQDWTKAGSPERLMRCLKVCQLVIQGGSLCSQVFALRHQLCT